MAEDGTLMSWEWHIVYVKIETEEKAYCGILDDDLPIAGYNRM